MSFEYQSLLGKQIQTFYFDAYPNVIFNGAFQAIDILSQNLTCKLPRTLDFDVANSLNVVQYTAAAFYGAGGCSSILNPFLFGYSLIFPQASFSISVDMDSFVTAIAVNSAIRNNSNLGIAEPSTYVVEYDGGNYTLSFKVSWNLQVLIPCTEIIDDYVLV
jgi:hypothetical protein